MDKPSQTLLVVFIAIAALSILVQAGFTVAMFIGARKAQKKSWRSPMTFVCTPCLQSCPPANVIQDITPKLKTITDNLTAISTTLRGKTDQVSGLVGDVTERAQAQASRVDGMVKGTLDQLTFAVQAMEHGVAAPVRQVNGILNGLRAGVDVMRKKNLSNHRDPEDDLFV